MKFAGKRVKMGRPKRAFSAGVAFVFALAFSVAYGETVIELHEDGPQTKNLGFSIPKEDQKYVELLEDFSRYADKKQWELAFKAISAAAEANSKGMVPLKDGFYVPLSYRIRTLLAELPPDGRQAYRLFNDGKARQLLEQLQNPETGKLIDEITGLQRIVDQYLITSVGDQAADMLGDLYFDRGDFVAAARMWDVILSHCPESGIPRIKFLIKKATAFARAGQMERFETEKQTVKNQFPGETVKIGGKNVSAIEFLETLKSSLKTSPMLEKHESRPLLLSEANATAWQMQFMDPETMESIRNHLVSTGQIYLMSQFAGIMPAADTDGKRVYVNWLGIGFAVDVQTGKLLWRTDKFSELGSSLPQILNYNVDFERYSLALVDDSVIFSRVPPGQWHRGGNLSLSCHEAATGKQKWISTAGPLSTWAFSGSPFILGQTLFIVGQLQESQQQLRLAAIDVKTGRMEWNILLGTPQTGQNYRGDMQVSPSVMIHQEGFLYVLTNNGAMLAVNLAQRKLEWAFTYEMSNPLGADMMWRRWRYAPESEKTAAGAIVLSAGVIYLKESGGRRLYAVDPVGPSLTWKRPIESNDTIAQVDEKFIYLVGEDLGAVDLASRELKWSARLPQQFCHKPMIAGNHLLMALGRGIYEFDATNGDTVRIFRGDDRESIGGALYRAEDRLICVSNLAVTAYRVTSPQAVQKN